MDLVVTYLLTEGGKTRRNAAARAGAELWIRQLAEARGLLRIRPELINTVEAWKNEYTALHRAVLGVCRRWREADRPPVDDVPPELRRALRSGD